MAIFVVSYDAHRDHDYTPIETYLGRMDSFHALGSTWLVNTSADASSVLNGLKAASQASIEIIVSDFHVATWTVTGMSDWLRTHGVQVS